MSTLYNYKIGYYSHEESDYVELVHEKKFTDDELTEIIAKAAVETVKRIKQAEDHIHSFQDIFRHDLIQYLVEKFGFKDIKYELFWSAFGWGSIFDKTDWEGDRGDHLDKITDAINRAGFSRRDDDYLRKDDELLNEKGDID